MSRPTEEQLAAFRADLEAVCTKHNFALAVDRSESIVIVPAGDWSAENLQLIDWADGGVE